jgi:hypothetical protein
MCVKYGNIHEMGLFGSDVQNIAISTSAAGKATADISLPIPVWEIIIIAAIVVIILLILKSFLKNYFEKQVTKHAKRVVVAETV